MLPISTQLLSFWHLLLLCVLLLQTKITNLCKKQYNYSCISNIKKSLVIEQQWQFTRALTCIRELLSCSVTRDLFVNISNGSVATLQNVFSHTRYTNLVIILTFISIKNTFFHNQGESLKNYKGKHFRIKLNLYLSIWT